MITLSVDQYKNRLRQLGDQFKNTCYFIFQPLLKYSPILFTYLFGRSTINKFNCPITSSGTSFILSIQLKTVCRLSVVKNNAPIKLSTESAILPPVHLPLRISAVNIGGFQSLGSASLQSLRNL